ncbi:MAG: hypothetical protein HY681_03340 [Chloroflexi bacterium]|nr:hypothetical protein [Chloroflexota bacterium]
MAAADTGPVADGEPEKQDASGQRLRHCIFCGKRPVRKTKEHVLPQWLIRVTGDPARPFHVDPLVRDNLGTTMFGFNRFVFPACSLCNEQFSSLESTAKPVMGKLLEAQPITPDEVNVLLDWFDKIRIGLWLGWLQLTGNPFGIRPSFDITRRIRRSDRCLLIYSARNSPTGLTFFGVNSLVFQWMPSCFTLKVNQLLFFNASNLMLLAPRLGLPFVKSAHCDPQGVFHVVAAAGYRKRKYPLIRMRLEEPALDFYQPILGGPERMIPDGPSWIPPRIYDTDFVRDSVSDIQTGLGHIFTQQRLAVVRFNEGTVSIDLSRQGPVDYAGQRYRNVVEQTLRFQEELISSAVPGSLQYEALPKEGKRVYDTLIKEIKRRRPSRALQSR